MAVQRTVALWRVESGPALLSTAAQLLAQVSTGQHRSGSSQTPSGRINHLLTLRSTLAHEGPFVVEGRAMAYLYRDQISGSGQSATNSRLLFLANWKVLRIPFPEGSTGSL